MNIPSVSITRLIPGVQQGDERAIEALRQRYVARVQGLVRPLMAGLPSGAGDEVDVARSTFRAFSKAAAEGQTPNLEG